MTLVQGKSCFPQKNHISKAFISFSFYKSNNEDQKNPLGSNKYPTESLEAPSPKAPTNVTWYTKKDLKQIIQTVFQAQTSKKRAKNKTFKAKLPDDYCGKSHMKCS